MTLRGLKPVTYYTVRVFAINNLGRSEPSEVMKFRTDEEAPGGPPLNIRAVALSSRSIKVSWKPPREDLQFGQIKGYYVGYKVASSDVDQFIYKTLDGSKTDSSVTHTVLEDCHLNGLKRFTKYSITVQAFNSKGTGPSSEVIETQTLPNDPPPAPLLRVSSVTTSSIHLSWSLKTDDPEAEVTPVTGFVLHQKKQDSTSDFEELRLPGDRNSHSFERLACGSKYQYYIVAFNAVGKSDASEVLSAQTEGMAPVAPDKHSLLMTNTSAATIFLDSWHDGSCPISSFDIVYKPKKNVRSKGESMRIFPAEQKQVVLKDLLPSTMYEVKMSAVNEAGTTEAVYNFTTGSLIRAIPAIGSGNDMASIHGSSTVPSPLHLFDPNLILPTTIAVVMVILLIFVVRIWLLRKRQTNSNFYGTVYGSWCPFTPVPLHDVLTWSLFLSYHRNRISRSVWYNQISDWSWVCLSKWHGINVWSQKS